MRAKLRIVTVASVALLGACSAPPSGQDSTADEQVEGSPDDERADEQVEGSPDDERADEQVEGSPDDEPASELGTETWDLRFEHTYAAIGVSDPEHGHSNHTERPTIVIQGNDGEEVRIPTDSAENIEVLGSPESGNLMAILVSFPAENADQAVERLRDLSQKYSISLNGADDRVFEELADSTYERAQIDVSGRPLEPDSGPPSRIHVRLFLDSSSDTPSVRLRIQVSLNSRY